MSGVNLVSPRERVLYLKTLPGFEDVEIGNIRKVARYLEEHHLRRGEYLCREGEPVQTAHFLVEGTVELVRNDEALRELSAPQMLGLTGMLASGSQAPGTIRCRSRVVSLSIDLREAIHVWESSFDLVRGLIRNQAEIVWLARDRLPFDPQHPPEYEPGAQPKRRLDLVDKLTLQLQSPFLRRANLEAVAEICRNQQQRHLEDSEPLFASGDDAHNYIRIVSGVVDVVRDDQSVGAVGAGYTIGLFEALAEVPRGYTAISRGESVVLCTEVGTLMEVLEDHFPVAMKILGYIEQLAMEHLWRSGPEQQS